MALSPACRLALPLAVWVIYLSDRLLDSIGPDGIGESARHSFYRYHRVPCLALLAAVSSVLAATIQFLPPDVLHSGFMVSVLVGAYMLLVHSQPFLRAYLPKELVVAVIFSSGTTLVVWTRMAHPSAIVLPALLFAFVCWLNCCAIEVWESRRTSNPSLRGTLESWLVRRLTPVSLGACCISVLLLPSASFHLLLLAVAFCSFGYCWVERIQSSLHVDAVRVLADLPLVVPILFLGLR